MSMQRVYSLSRIKVESWCAIEDGANGEIKVYRDKTSSWSRLRDGIGCSTCA